jgi:hypothetical protein
MARAAPCGEIGKHDADVNCACKDASTETADGLRCYLGNINWGNYSCLPDADSCIPLRFEQKIIKIKNLGLTCNESTCIDLTETAIVCQEDDDAEDPDDAKLTGSPQTADAVGDEES